MLIEDLNKNIISNDELDNLLTTEYSEALKSFKSGNIIFKGMYGSTSKDTPMLLNPIENRRSRNTRNYYTLWLNNHDSWANFPNRNVIATTNYRYALQFGSPYIIFPKNGTSVGMCPSFDFWESFDYPINILVEEVHYLLEDTLGIIQDPSSYDNMLKLFKAFDELVDKREYIEYSRLPDSMKEEILSNGLSSLFVKYLKPKNFSLSTIDNFKSKTDREVWFDNQFIAIRHSNETIDYLKNY